METEERVCVLMDDGYYWSFASGTAAEKAATFLAERSHRVRDCEPRRTDDPFQVSVCELYTEYGGEPNTPA
jgi:hypothetical protein